MNRTATFEGWTRILSVTAILAVTSLQCSDDPNDVGIGVLPPEDLVSIDTVRIRDATSVTFKKFISPNTVSLLTGTYNGYEARTLIRFRSLPDTLRDASVLSATLRMKPFYTFGDSTTALTFTVHSIALAWEDTSATWNSVNAAGFFDGEQRGSFSQVVSDTAEVAVTLDPTLAQEWLTAAADSVEQFGMLLLPAAGLSVIKGFTSFQSTFPPRIEIIYERSGNVDTLTWNLGSDIHVANVELPSEPELMNIQAGVSYRSRLRFDVSAVPTGATVHNATLELTIDRSASELGGPRSQVQLPFESLIAHHVTDSSGNVFESTAGVITATVEGSPDLLTVNLTSSVQRWVLGESNQGVILRSFYEQRGIERIAIFSSLAADDENRPDLLVTYSPILR